MYNLMIGPPGGGKSYEAVVYHVLPTLESGRKVITNLPLNVAEFAKIDQRFPALIELRTKTRAVEPSKPVQGRGPKYSPHVFGNLEDYGDDWRHPETGQGPLYVIDECHKALPRGDTNRLVEEWYAEHRHEGADVLLMTQSYGKVSKAITDSAQVVYKVKKMTAFGKPKSYVRKVQDGVRGEVMSQAVRHYEGRYFKLYKSHTRSVASVIEADAKDIAPAYKKWMYASYCVLAFAACILLFKLYSAYSDDDQAKAPTPAGERSAAPSTASPAAVGAPQPATIPVSPDARLVGVVLLPGGRSHAMIHTASGDYRAPLTKCKKDLGGWQCELNGYVINERTGPQPTTTQAPSLMSVGGMLKTES